MHEPSYEHSYHRLFLMCRANDKYSQVVPIDGITRYQYTLIEIVLKLIVRIPENPSMVFVFKSKTFI